MADQDEKPTITAAVTADVSVNDLPPLAEPNAVQSLEGEAVKGGGINRVVVTDGSISAKP